MHFELVRRERASTRMAFVAPLLALACTVAVSFVLFAILGRSASQALWLLTISPFLSWYDFSEVLLKTGPLLLIAQGLAIGFRARIFNIGAEGQLVLGAIFASAIPVWFPEATSTWLWALMLCLGVLGGALWAAIAAFWRTVFNANEILVTLMLSLIATQLLNALLLGPWKDPNGFNFPETGLFQDAAMLPILWPGTRVNVSLIAGVAVTLLAWLLMQRSLAGYRLIVGGAAPAAAGYAGFSATRTVWISLLVSGGVAGLAGAAEVAGPIGQLQPQVIQGYGFAAIIVAYLGGLHPLGIVVASFLMATLYIGGDNAMVSANLPVAAVQVMQGLLLVFYLMAVTLVRYRIVKHQGAPA